MRENKIKKSVNAEKYRFADFTFDNYRNLLHLAKKNFKFNHFEEINRNTSNWIIWRHDIDFSPENAIKMAEIEKEEGISSTYFLLLHSRYYNLLSIRVKELILQIQNLGHQIGLHFDPNYYNIDNEQELGYYIKQEAGIIEELFGCKVSVFSFHNPTTFSLKGSDHQYGGILNAQSNIYYDEKNGYCSDSNGYWRYDTLEDMLTDKKCNKLQVLTHPVWWTEKVKSPKERLWDCLEQRINNLKEYYKEEKNKYDRLVIDW